jgi:hypothetical protein
MRGGRGGRWRGMDGEEAGRPRQWPGIDGHSDRDIVREALERALEPLQSDAGRFSAPRFQPRFHAGFTIGDPKLVRIGFRLRAA